MHCYWGSILYVRHVLSKHRDTIGWCRFRWYSRARMPRIPCASIHMDFHVRMMMMMMYTETDIWTCSARRTEMSQLSMPRRISFVVTSRSMMISASSPSPPPPRLDSQTCAKFPHLLSLFLTSPQITVSFSSLISRALSISLSFSLSYTHTYIHSSLSPPSHRTALLSQVPRHTSIFLP